MDKNLNSQIQDIINLHTNSLEGGFEIGYKKAEEKFIKAIDYYEKEGILKSYQAEEIKMLLDDCICGKCGDPLMCEHDKDEPHERGMCGNCI